MRTPDLPPKALFFSPDGHVYPDSLVCTGVMPTELGGKPCPHSVDGRPPYLNALDARDAGFTIDEKQPDDLYPACAKQRLAFLSHEQDPAGQNVVGEGQPLRLFKCRMGFWFVVVGLSL